MTTAPRAGATAGRGRQATRGARTPTSEHLFAMIGGQLHTPALDGAILPGITRDSLIALARNRVYRVHERPMPIDELLAPDLFHWTRTVPTWAMPR